MSIPLLSIITPFYNEEEGIQHYFATVVSILRSITKDFEIICVDDGSRDATLALLLGQAGNDDRIKVLELARNFGKEAALSAGIDHCTGAAAIPLDADLQDPPELIPEMVELWQKSQEVASIDMKIDVVLPIRSSRKDPLIKRATAWLFYKLMSWISQTPLPEQAADFRLLDKRVIDVVKQLREKNRFMRGLLAWPGFRIERISYSRPERIYGSTKYNYTRMFSYALDGIFAFSVKPLRLFSLLGIVTLFIDIFLAIRTLYIKIWWDTAMPGYTSTLLIFLFFAGIILIGQGIMGEYIGRIYHEVKDRPIYALRNSYNFSPKM